MNIGYLHELSRTTTGYTRGKLASARWRPALADEVALRRHFGRSKRSVCLVVAEISRVYDTYPSLATCISSRVLLNEICIDSGVHAPQEQ